MELGIEHVLGRGLSLVDQGWIARQLDNIGKAAGKASDAVGDALRRLSTTVRDELSNRPAEAANALADSMRGPAARKLTAGETAAVRKAFGHTIDLSNVRIVNGPGRNPDAWTAFNVGGNPAITEGNTVYIRSDRYAADLSKSAGGANTLVHEFTHVRQYQKLGFSAFFAQYAQDLVGSSGNRHEVYDYALRNTVFVNETIEGQAAMVDDYAGYKAGEAKLDPKQIKDIERRLKGTGIFGR